MAIQPRPLFESSFAALTLVDAYRTQNSGLRARPPDRRPKRGTAMAMAIQFAPEPDPTANTLELQEEQTTGPLPLGFEFEFFGVYYTRFDLASNGFIAFGNSTRRGCLHSAPHLPSILLNEDFGNSIGVWYFDALPPGAWRISYEVRGNAQRRRLVISVRPIAGASEIDGRPMTAQVILHERTGMIEVHATTRKPGDARTNEAGVRYTTSPGVGRRTA